MRIRPQGMTLRNRALDIATDKRQGENRGDRVPGFVSRFPVLIFSRRLEIGLLAVILAVFFVKPNDMFGSHWKLRVILSMVLILAGMILRIWAGGCAGSHTGDSKIQAPRLATGGPYAHVRNPIYFGTILIGLGMSVLIGDWRLIPICLLTFIVLYAAIVPAEEKFLRKSFGMEYEAYFRGVPRWIPRPVRWSESHNAPFNWGILAGEARIAAVLVFIFGVIKCAAFLK